MFLITDMTTGERRVDTAFASYDDAVTALGGPAECNDFCSRNGCDIIWHDDDEYILEDHEKTLVIHDPCGYCGPSTNPNDICRNCWDQMQGA